MGYPLRSNIFKAGTGEQQYFAQFPIQVAVLFSPKDASFAEAFGDLFLHLDELSGKHVVFFAVLDPPREWIWAAQDRAWWLEYQARVGESGFSYDDRVLVMELARLFRLSWNELPALVASTNLWTGEFVTTPTTQWHIEKQLTALTELAQEWGQPTTGHIIETLQELFEGAVEYHPPDSDLRHRLARMYGVLDTYRPQEDFFNQRRFERLARRELGTAKAMLRGALRRRKGLEDVREGDNEAYEAVAADATGHLVAPATVAERVYGFAHTGREFGLIGHLEEESAGMVETALRVGQFLEDLINRDPQAAGRIDFSAGAQGTWKALEYEVNFSLIQAARAARTIRMPEDFARYVPGFPKAKSKVTTGSRKHDLNVLDWDQPQTERHRFLTLGSAWHVIKTLLDDPDEIFDTVLRRCLHGPLPGGFFDNWEAVNRIRNKGSHTTSLSRTDYDEVLERILESETMEPLITIKQALRNPDQPPRLRFRLRTQGRAEPW